MSSQQSGGKGTASIKDSSKQVGQDEEDIG